MYRIIKRIIDIFLSLLLMPFFILLILIVGIAIKLESRGKIFYISERLGRNAMIFKMYKFRSMYENAPDIRNEDGSTYNSKDDHRVTKVGKFIRETSIDEIPQVLNILKGDMSFIGPRPNLPDDLETFRYDERPKLEVRPGLTGYTQAYYRNEITVREKKLGDARYAQNYSFILDVKIFLKTVETIIKKEGLYTNTH